MTASGSVPGSMTGGSHATSDTVNQFGGSTQLDTRYLALPSGTPSTGQVPVATGTGHATAWGSAGGGGTIVPVVVTLTDASTVTVNGSAGNDYRLLTTSGVGGTRKLGNPSGLTDGQEIIFQVTQAASGGPYLLTYDTNYAFSVQLPAPVLSTTASALDVLKFIWNAGKGKLLFVAYLGAF